MMGAEFGECRQKCGACFRRESPPELRFISRKIDFGRSQARRRRRADRLGLEALQSGLLDAFRFQFEAFYLTAKGLAYCPGYVCDSGLQRSEEHTSELQS